MLSAKSQLLMFFLRSSSSHSIFSSKEASLQLVTCPVLSQQGEVAYLCMGVITMKGLWPTAFRIGFISL